jgi:hypothetical protein
MARGRLPRARRGTVREPQGATACSPLLSTFHHGGSIALWEFGVFLAGGCFIKKQFPWLPDSRATEGPVGFLKEIALCGE